MEPNDRNVLDFEVLSSADDIANAVFCKNTGFSTDASSVAKYGRIEHIVSNSDVSESSEVASQLAGRKDGIVTVELEPDIQDFSFADIGDLVAVYLDN